MAKKKNEFFDDITIVTDEDLDDDKEFLIMDDISFDLFDDYDDDDEIFSKFSRYEDDKIERIRRRWS